MAIVKDIKTDKIPTKGSEVYVIYIPDRGIESLAGLEITRAGDFRCFLHIELTAEEKLQLVKNLLEQTGD